MLGPWRFLSSIVHHLCQLYLLDNVTHYVLLVLPVLLSYPLYLLVLPIQLILCLLHLLFQFLQLLSKVNSFALEGWSETNEDIEILPYFKRRIELSVNQGYLHSKKLQYLLQRNIVYLAITVTPFKHFMVLM